MNHIVDFAIAGVVAAAIITATILNVPLPRHKPQPEPPIEHNEAKAPEPKEPPPVASVEVLEKNALITQEQKQIEQIEFNLLRLQQKLNRIEAKVEKK